MVATWNGTLEGHRHLMITAQDSVGFDVRDFAHVQMLLEQIRTHNILHPREEVHVTLAVDVRLQPLFAENLPKGIAHYVHWAPFQRGQKPALEIIAASVAAGIPPIDAAIGFAELSTWLPDASPTPTGYLHGETERVKHLSCPVDGVSLAVPMLCEQPTKHVVYAPFVWQKPQGSDFGGADEAERRAIGQIMSMTLMDMAEMFRQAQALAKPHGVVIVPLMAQYGNPVELFLSRAKLVEEMGFDNMQPPPILLPMEQIEWSNDFAGMVAFLENLSLRHTHLPEQSAMVVGIGSTLHHLAQAVGGIPQVIAAHRVRDTAGQIVDGQGVAFWRQAAEQDSNMQLVAQTEPGNWANVVTDMAKVVATTALKQAGIAPDADIADQRLCRGAIDATPSVTPSVAA